MDYEIFSLGNVQLQSGEVLEDAKLAYKTYGELNAARDNVVVIPTFYTGTHVRNEAYFGAGRAVDPAHHFVVSPNLFGNALSTSPSNAIAACRGSHFPTTTLFDNVACQQRLLVEALGIERIALVMGWSMGACQSFQWGAQYPDRVDAILPFCGSAKTSPHNYVFLDGVKAALQADAAYAGGDYVEPPAQGLKAFARVYAGWAFSQTFYREHWYRTKFGFETVEDLLRDWEQDHLAWDANNLLLKLRSWQLGDISDNSLYNGSLKAALGAIRARAIVIPCNQDLYCPPEDNQIEVSMMPNAQCRPFDSPFGHCVASGNNEPKFQMALDAAIRELLPH